MATVTFLEPGTDATQDFTIFGSSGASAGSSITSATDQPHTGTRSIKVVCANVGDDAQCTNAVATCADAGTAISLWVRFNSVAPSTKTLFLDVYNAGLTNPVLGIGLDTTGKLAAGGWGTTVTGGSAVLVANTWYRVCLSYVITSTTVWSASIYLNGVLEISLSAGVNGNLSGTGSSFLNIGTDTTGSITWVASSSFITMWLADIYIDDR